MYSYGPLGYGRYSCSYAGTSLCMGSDCSSYDDCYGTGDWSGNTVAQQEQDAIEEAKTEPAE